MRPLNLLHSTRSPILCLLWLFGLATLTTGAATGVNRFSAFSQPVGPFTVTPDDEEIVVRLPSSHSSVSNFGGQGAPRAQQNLGIPLSFSPQGDGFDQQSPARDTQEPHLSPKFFVLKEDSNGNGNGNGRSNAAVRSHFVTPGSQPRGIPLDVVSQRSSAGITSAAANNVQTPNPSSRFFVSQNDDLNVNVRANSVRSNGFSGTANGNGLGRSTNGNVASRGVPLPLGNQGNTFKSVSKNSSPSSTSFFVVENTDDFEDNLAIMSLGRRFHPNGVPIISNPIETPVTKEASVKAPEVQSPFLLTPNSLFVLKDESIEDLRDADMDDQKIVVDLSPMVKSHNHDTANERLSLSSNFLNQYNFVDVKGSTSFGYKTDDQYQDHIVHRSGKHEGKFGWTAPEGSKHHIEYIADEKGYRVITSSGIYLNDEATVKVAKDNHFNEHKKVLDNLASMKRNNVLKTEQAQSEQSGTFGIPLSETTINGQRESSAGGPQPGFVVIESDIDIPLLNQEPEDVIVPIQYPEETFGGVAETVASGSSVSTGIPLPEIPVRADGSAVEPSQPTSSQGGSQFAITFDDPENIIVPIQYPGETFGGAVTTAEQPAAGGTGSSPTFGIPIPGSPIRADGSSVEPSQPSSNPGGSQFGITLQDPEDVIVPIQYPDETFGTVATAPVERPVAGGADSSPAFGIPIPESPVRAESSPIETSQTTFPQDGGQFGITLQDPENVIVPIQYPEETFGGAADAPAERPVAGGTDSSPAFGIPIPESPVRAESSPVETLQTTFPQDGDQFGITHQDPENVIVPIQYPEETFEGAAGEPVESSAAGGTDSYPDFGITVPETPVRTESQLPGVETQPMIPSETAEASPAEDEFSDIFGPPMSTTAEESAAPAERPVERPVAGETDSSSAFGIPILETQYSGAETAATSPVEDEFFENFGPEMPSINDTPRVPEPFIVESPKLSVEIGLKETAPNQIEGFGVGLPSPTQWEEQDLNPITGTGGFTIIKEDQPFTTFNNERNNVASNSEVNVPTDNVRPGGSTFSNQFFVVSPGNANQGVGLFPDETANQDGGNPSDLLQGPPSANNENKNLIRRRF